MNNSNSKVPIHIIDTEKKLQEFIEHIKISPELFIDTEFDDFNTQYGVHLQLIQVFDGISCFLIDTIQIKNLNLLWPVFENENICKVLYSGANDIAILKKYGCNTRNIFDIQVAALLCNRTANSYSALIHAEFGIEIDKSQQRSNWGNRPLHASQLTYASNDVIYLARLKEIFLEEISKKNMLHILQEENILIEAATKKDYEPKLSGKQKRIFNSYAKSKLMEFKILINYYAKLLNVPPFYIVRDGMLEEIIKDKMSFLSSPFVKGFYKDALNNDLFKKQFLEIVHAIDSNRGWENRVKEKISSAGILNNFNDSGLTNKSFLPFKQYIITRYGEVAGTSMLNGLSKIIVDGEVNWEDAKQYQRDLYKDFISR